VCDDDALRESRQPRKSERAGATVAKDQEINGKKDTSSAMKPTAVGAYLSRQMPPFECRPKLALRNDGGRQQQQQAQRHARWGVVTVLITLDFGFVIEKSSNMLLRLSSCSNCEVRTEETVETLNLK
jgi:hypothetical protein